MSSEASQIATFDVEVSEIVTASDTIRLLTLRPTDGGALPGFEPGAHISIRIPPGGERPAEMWRNYSLIALPEVVDETRAPQATYRIGVLREDVGRGGSRYLHEAVSAGGRLTIRVPPNGFPLNAGGPTPVLLAGGIGITPLATMAAALRAAGLPVTLHYTCRAPGQHVLLPELFALLGADLYLYADSDPHRRFDLDRFLGALAPGQPIYVCGPEGLIDALRAKAREKGWSDGEVHYELFSDTAPAADAEAFEVELSGSGQVLKVPADKSLLDVLIENDVFVMYDCRQGHCGLCSATVLSGEIVHNDIYLTDEQKAAGDVMQICVSRGKGRLVLDI